MIAIGVAAALLGTAVSRSVWRRGVLPTADTSGGFRSVPVVVALAIAVAGWKASLPSVAVAGPLLVGISSVERLRRIHAREVAAIDEQLPSFVDAMIQQLRSGVGLHMLCSRPPRIADQVDVLAAPMVAALAAGEPLVEAVARFGSVRLDDQTIAAVEGPRLVATALGVMAERGGPAVPALQRLRLTLSGTAHGRSEARARASQALASARLLTAAPALFALLLASFDDTLADLYLRQPIGAVCISACIGLTYGGWRWMNHIVSGVASG